MKNNILHYVWSWYGTAMLLKGVILANDTHLSGIANDPIMVEKKISLATENRFNWWYCSYQWL